MVSGSPHPLRAGPLLDRSNYDQLRQKLILESCKWDPQVGDVETISRFPLIFSAEQWRLLSSLAEGLTQELMSAERELIDRIDLHRAIGLPRRFRSLFRNQISTEVNGSSARVLRFDFHWTDEGWKISEVNSDVPGGYSEASELPSGFMKHYPGTHTAGHPGAAWADALCADAAGGTHIALLSAAGFMEDRQVLAYLSQLLLQRGMFTHWARLEDLSWSDGSAFMNVGVRRIQLGAIVRFYQAEWLKTKAALRLFVGNKTPVSNPGFAMLTESKRFPLVWNELSTKMTSWKKLLPETCDPRQAPWKDDDSWLVKSAFCNTGDTVAIRRMLTTRQWRQVKRAVFWNPGSWVAQRRFNILPVQTPVGPIYPCVGVYSINGKISGIYGRYSHRPVIDFAAVDVAILVEDEGGAST